MYLFKPQWNWIKIGGEITAWTDVPHWRRRIMWDYGICGLSVKRQNHSFTVEQRLQIILTTVSFVYSNYFTAAPLMWQGRIDPAAASRMQHSFLFWLSALSPAPRDEGCSPFVALSPSLISSSSLHHPFCLHVSLAAQTPAAALFLTPEFYYSSSPRLWGLGLKCSAVSFIAFPCALPPLSLPYSLFPVCLIALRVEPITSFHPLLCHLLSLYSHPSFICFPYLSPLRQSDRTQD